MSYSVKRALIEAESSEEGTESLSSSAVMADSNQSSQNVSYNSDWNSNQFLSSDVKQTDQKSLDDSFLQQYNNIKETAKRDYLSRKSPNSPGSSPSTTLYSIHQKDLSYDDLSKNIDANLAEIDMETFRSEDINSILALPAIYSGGEFQAEEQCASVSGSMLNDLNMDSSACNRHSSEDEISISKDSPLFSPLREPPHAAAATATISVDSLDNSSGYLEQDLVLTCKANKNNYTIVFEGSGTSDDYSDYQQDACCRSSEEESSLAGAQQKSNFKKQSSMVQSDVAFTTWSKLWKSQRVIRRKSCDTSTKISSKSQSLPNLSHSSVFITDKQLSQWAKWCGNHRNPLYEIIQGYQAAGIRLTNSKECLHSVSLLKMFMKHRVSSNSSIGSSIGQSDSSTSLILQPLNLRNFSLQNSLNGDNNKSVKPLQRNEEDTETATRNDNNTRNTTTVVDNIQALTEANNNNINSLYNIENDDDSPNNNNATVTDDCDNSQYFEDGLMDVPSPPLKHFHATPIKEEEETDLSSGDEIMRDSKNPFGSDDSSSGEITIIQNKTLDQAKGVADLERVNAIFKPNVPQNKGSNENLTGTPRKYCLRGETPKKPTESHSTQTKQFNLNDLGSTEMSKPLHSFSCKTSSNQTDCDTVNIVQYTTSRDSSPASSGYVSSRHSSLERLRPQSGSSVAQKTSVVMTTSCTCGTQIPIHVKDSSVQTTTLSASNSSSGFTLKESTIFLPEPSHSVPLQNTVKIPLQNISSQTSRHQQKDKKSVYVCYPNYSLPDLSFLRSVIEENSESVFLTPTEYKLPQEILSQKRPSRPKSYGTYESLLQKQFKQITDWESLNVLLPDDLKVLLSKKQVKGWKGTENSKSPAHFSKPTFHQLSSSYCNMDDATKLKATLADPVLMKRHAPRSILRKSSSAGHCEDKDGQCKQQNSCEDEYLKPDGRKYHQSSSEPKQVITACKSSSPLKCPFSPNRRSSFEKCREDLLQDLPGKNLFTENVLSFDNKSEDQGGSCLGSKKAVKFCERSPTKTSKHLDSCKVAQCCGCQNKSPDGFHSAQCSCDLCVGKTHEFLLSPTHNSFLFPEFSDSYTFQNFSGGGKFFQEALRRKTGLVENLRKATQIIFEHHKTATKKGMDSSLSMGQKILTWLCPAVHTILSDGLLPSVQGFFGPLPNSPWKVAGTSIKQGETRKDVEDLLNHINSEKLLTDSTYRFNAFILGLLNLGCFEWWLGHLCACQSLICHHYHPTALLSLLALPAAAHLRHELKELVGPLSGSFQLDLLLETKVTCGETWKKYDEGNCRPEGTKDLTLPFSPHKQKTNDFNLKGKHHAAPAATCGNPHMNIHPNEECPEVWPGITINPFPNAKFAKLPGRMADLTNLCSSADSGCSSQVDQQHLHHVAAGATPDASPCVDQREGQGFKVLRQKWEKMSHSPKSPGTPRTPTKSPARPAVPGNKPSGRPATSKAAASPRRRGDPAASPRTPTKVYPQTPPASRRTNPTSGSQVQQIQASSAERRSHIPMLKMKGSQQNKSMIPVQKVTSRARSANRDLRCPSD